MRKRISEIPFWERKHTGRLIMRAAGKKIVRFSYALVVAAMVFASCTKHEEIAEPQSLYFSSENVTGMCVDKNTGCSYILYSDSDAAMDGERLNVDDTTAKMVHAAIMGQREAVRGWLLEYTPDVYTYTHELPKCK